MKKMKLEEIKKRLFDYGLYDLYDDYVDDTHITIIINDNDTIFISILIEDDTSNYIILSKNDFMQLDDISFLKLINELVFYAQ